MVRQHHATHLVRGLYIRRPFTESHLDGGRAPRNEVSQLSLPDSLQRLMHLSWVHLSLDNIQNRDVSSLLDGLGNEDIFGLQKSTHHIEHSSFSDVHLF